MGDPEDNLLPKLTGPVLRFFANALADRLREIPAMDKVAFPSIGIKIEDLQF